MSRRSKKPLAAVLVAASLSAPVLVATPGAAAPVPAADPRVVHEWNAIAARTIVSEHAVPAPVSSLYFGFVSLAVHDAVVSVHGRHQPRAPQARPHPGASSDVAAAAAAHRVLQHYFPASSDALAADYAATLAGLPQRADREHAERAGRAAADSLIAQRQQDGRDSDAVFAGRDGIGQWQAEGTATMLAPWLGKVRTLALHTPTRMPLPGPDALTSAAYAADLAEVEEMGARTGSSRTAEQTDTAFFWSASPVAQYHGTLRQQVAQRGLDITDSARSFALLSSSIADALITCWRAKVEHNYWRPDAAIRQADADGNPATSADPDWLPLVANPPYPEYPSGHACVTGAASETFDRLFGTSALGLEVRSGSQAPKVFDTTDALDADAANGRIWLGIHFRKAMTDGNDLGHRVAAWVHENRFRRTG